MLARLFAPQAMVGPAGYVRDVERVYGGKTECLKLSILEIDQSAEACQDVKTRMQPRMQRVPTVSTWVCLKICDPKIHGVIIDSLQALRVNFPFSGTTPAWRFPKCGSPQIIHQKSGFTWMYGFYHWYTIEFGDFPIRETPVSTSALHRAATS